jgi:co-chaperonin GroES (HSP10)
MKNLEPIKNSIIFSFDDVAVVKGRFVETTESGIYLGKDYTLDAGAPRWGRVLSLGPDVKDVVDGDKILIEASQWTYEMEFEGKKIWRTTEDKVLAVAE